MVIQTRSQTKKLGLTSHKHPSIGLLPRRPLVGYLTPRPSVRRCPFTLNQVNLNHRIRMKHEFKARYIKARDTVLNFVESHPNFGTSSGGRTALRTGPGEWGCCVCEGKLGETVFNGGCYCGKMGGFDSSEANMARLKILRDDLEFIHCNMDKFNC